MRHLLYLVDAVHLNVVVARAMRSGSDVIIFDRYIYDELANLPLTNPLTRLWVQIIRLDGATAGLWLCFSMRIPKRPARASQSIR